MQSPINISERVIVSDEKETKLFNFKVDLGQPKFMVVKDQSEIKVQFISKGGTFRILYRDSELEFQPVGISFRFPGEHTVNDLRSKGEIIIKMRQSDNDQVKQTIND